MPLGTFLLISLIWMFESCVIYRNIILIIKYANIQIQCMKLPNVTEANNIPNITELQRCHLIITFNTVWFFFNFSYSDECSGITLCTHMHICILNDIKFTVLKYVILQVLINIHACIIIISVKIQNIPITAESSLLPSQQSASAEAAHKKYSVTIDYCYLLQDVI